MFQSWVLYNINKHLTGFYSIRFVVIGFIEQEPRNTNMINAKTLSSISSWIMEMTSLQ